MSNQIRSLDRIIVANPCDADWDSMIGNDQVRFCEHCNLHVNDLSSMTRQEAMRLVARSRGRLCVRYIERPLGGVLTKQLPEKLHRISRRISRFAAGAFTATLSLSSAGQTRSPYPVVDPDGVKQGQAVRQSNLAPAETAASLLGVITDPNEAVVPGASVVLISDDSHREQTTISSGLGEYSFSALSPGSYSLRISRAGFKSFEITNILLNASSNQSINASLEVGAVTMGIMVAIVEPEEPIVKAVFKNDLDLVNELAISTRDINVRDRSTNMTALDQAVENGNLEIVRSLLLFGADVRVKSASGRTALMYLRADATAELVRDLLSAGARLNARDESGGTALINAASECKSAVVKELIDAGAKLNVKDAAGKTALMFAATNEDPLVAKLLLDAGAEADAKDENGRTALMYAAEEGPYEVVKALIDGGADVNARNNDGGMPLILAASTNDDDSVRALLNAGAEIEARNNDGQTALMRAASNGYINSIDVLLNAGAEIGARTRDGKTVLGLARENKHEDAVKLLESRGAPE